MKSTLATRLAHAIRRDYVESGRLRPGDALPSIRELQGYYGGSVTTLAHALGQLEAQGLVEKRHGRGCYLARDAGTAGPGHGGQRTLGVVVPAPTMHELMARLYGGISAEAGRRGLGLRMATRAGGPALDALAVEQAGVAQLVEAGCDALVVSPAPRLYADLERDYLAREYRDTPIVLVDLALPEHERTQVVFDNRGAGREMTRLLLEAGHDRVAFMRFRSEGREAVWRSVDEREWGYREALRERGLAPRPEDYWVIDHRESWMDAYGNPKPEVTAFLRAWQGRKDRATGVVACFDQLAIALIQGAHALGLRVPEDLDVAGFDNMSQGQLLRPPFPTTDPDFGKAGEKAVELAVGLLDGEVRRGTSYVLPVPVLARRATPEGRVGVSAVGDARA